MLPFSCWTEENSCSSSQRATSIKSVARKLGPFISRTLVISVTSAPAKSSLMMPSVRWMPPVAASEASNLISQNRDPADGYPGFVTIAEHQIGLEAKRFQIDIGLHVAIEEHQA